MYLGLGIPWGGFEDFNFDRKILTLQLNPTVFYSKKILCSIDSGDVDARPTPL